MNKSNEDILAQVDSIAQHVIESMAKRVTAKEVEQIRLAYQLALSAHDGQFRKSGEPYIMHPVTVAAIVAEEMMLGANPVITAFLHDVVEDTDYTLEDIRRQFGPDVSFLVGAVTKPQNNSYEMTKQLDNFKQMLESFNYDIRALLVKLADRLHNMRTLQSMPTRKQVKIACETDQFYAPFANRLGLYNIKVELENLSLRYRNPQVYDELERQMADYRHNQEFSINAFASRIASLLASKGIEVRVMVEYLRPYSVWRKMMRDNTDFNHVQYRHHLRIVYECEQEAEEKDQALKIYSLLTDFFREKPGGAINYMNTPKENGYMSLHVQILADNGCWEMVQITSERMLRHNQLGCIAERQEDKVLKWVNKFKTVLSDLKSHISRRDFLENVTLSFYNDNITVFSPKGDAYNMSPQATALDYAFMIHTNLGLHAKSAHINGQLAPVTTVLKMGDVVTIDTDPNHWPEEKWKYAIATDKAAEKLRGFFARMPRHPFRRCHECSPIPGEEVVGFKDKQGMTKVHRRDCLLAIRKATKDGDTIVDVEFNEHPKILYPVAIQLVAVDRYHLLSDIINCITEQLKLSIDSLHTTTTDAIVNTEIAFSVHSFMELQSIIRKIAAINGIEEVKRKK